MLSSYSTVRFCLFNCPSLTLLQPSLPLIPPSDSKADSDKPNFKLVCQTEGEWRQLEGERNAEEAERESSLSPYPLPCSFSENWSGASTGELYCVTGRTRRVPPRHAWCNVAPSLPPHFLACQANDDDDNKEEEEIEKGTLRNLAQLLMIKISAMEGWNRVCQRALWRLWVWGRGRVNTRTTLYALASISENPKVFPAPTLSLL